MKRKLALDSMREGAGRIRERWGLAVLLYGVNLTVALLLALPVYTVLVEHVGKTGFGAELIERFDLMLWREIGRILGDVLVGIGWQLLWVLPLYIVWKTAVYMGVIYALHNGALWPFWNGVGYYTGSGLLIALLFLPLKLVWILAAFSVAGSLSSVWSGEVGLFWVWAVVFPLLIVTGVAILDLFQRYSRIAVVARHDTWSRAIAAGFSWPLKYRAAGYLYIAWFGIALLTALATVGLNAMLHVGTTAILVGFLIQQVSLFTQAAVTIGWIGSEVSLFERTYIHELPLIADAEVYDQGPDPDINVEGWGM